MRGVKAKRLRKLGLKSGPVHRERPMDVTFFLADFPWWPRKMAPNPAVEAKAEAKRARRRTRNQRILQRTQGAA